MKTNERILRRLRKDRPMTTISIRVPEDVIEDLKKVAPEFGFSGYQPLIRAYVGQGLRKDLTRLERDSAEVLTASLRRRGVAEEVIQEAIAEAGLERRRGTLQSPTQANRRLEWATRPYGTGTRDLILPTRGSHAQIRDNAGSFGCAQDRLFAPVGRSG